MTRQHRNEKGQFASENSQELFRIEIYLSKWQELSGLNALDFRRRLKLPDSTRVKWDMTYQDNPSCFVSESFARRWFQDRDSISVTHALRDEHLHLLAPGDLVPKGDQSQARGGMVALDPKMPASRIQELWIATQRG